MMLPAAVPGHVVGRSQDVAQIALLYDILKTEALSPCVFADLAWEAIERWT
jgi:hypothetical protein